MMDEVIPDILEFMSSFSAEDWNSTPRCFSEGDNEVEIIRELKTDLNKHRCYLCCQGDFLVNKMLHFSGILNNEYKFACETCDKSFKCKSALTKHKYQHVGTNFERNQNKQNKRVRVRKNNRNKRAHVRENNPNKRVHVKETNQNKRVHVKENNQNIRVHVKENNQNIRVHVKENNQNKRVHVKKNNQNIRVHVKENNQNIRVHVKENNQNKRAHVKENNQNIRAHVKENEHVSVMCKFCYKMFKSTKQIQRHYECKHGAITRVCEVCKIVFFNFNNFCQHCLNHTRLERKENVCKECGKQFLWKKSLKLHLSTHS